MSKFRLKIERDDSPSNPRENDNISIMHCWHRRYTLGDQCHGGGDDCSPHKVMIGIIADDNSEFEEQLEEWDRAEDATIKTRDEARAHATAYRERIETEFEKHNVMLPLFLYDHGGITMRTGAFSCRWDSGQVGFIYMPKKVALAELGGPEFKTKDWTPEKQARVEEVLRIDVEVYDQYLTGDVYGFTLQELVYEFEQPVEEIDVTDDELPWADGDSCWGFYGTDLEENGIMGHIGRGREEATKNAFNHIDEWVECPEEAPAPKPAEEVPA